MRKYRVSIVALAVVALLAACHSKETPPALTIHIYRDRLTFQSEGLDAALQRVRDRTLKTQSGRFIVVETADSLHLLPQQSGEKPGFELFILRSEDEKKEVHASLDGETTFTWKNKTYTIGVASGLTGDTVEAAQKVLAVFVEETKH
jgi:hypothetical protein